MDFLPSALAALSAYRQFIIYQLVPRDNGKNDKIPIDYRTGQIAAHGAHDPDVWIDHVNAINYAKLFGASYGVGFVFTDNDPFWFLDIDDCLDSLAQNWTPLAQQLMGSLPGAALEVSSSGKGLHIFGSARVIPPHSCRDSYDLDLEFYHTKRFVALTGLNMVGDITADLTDYLPVLINTYFNNANAAINGDILQLWDAAIKEGVSPEWNGPIDDMVLINRALNVPPSARAAFGEAASFNDLWHANYEVLSTTYKNNASTYDAALAQHLAYWTGNDAARIERLMWQSKLVRDKWQRADYLPRTILNARAKQTKFLNDKPAQSFDHGVEFNLDHLKPTLVNGNTFLTIDDQIKLFTGCVYIADVKSVLVPGGHLYGNDQFRAMYGGYSFQMDNVNQRVTRDAWEALTQSQAFRAWKVHTTCFRPLEPPAAIIEEDDQRVVNLWWPIKTPRIKGDPQLFLNHLSKLILDARDRNILLAYLAACVQYPGVKFQWAPFIQGVQGNGKTLFTLCVAYAIGRRYTHMARAKEIVKNFNAWLYRRLLIGVEDIYLPESHREVLEILKPMITGSYYEIESKGKDQATKDICCNFIINSNHKDGIRKISSDRRFAPFYTPHQTKEDLINDGLHGAYFLKLYNWLDKENGYAIVADYLQNYEIPEEFNPATVCKYAPVTTSTTEAIEYGLGAVEQEIINAIEQDEIGFRGGWVSSHYLDLLLMRIARGRIPQNKRRELLQNIGYDWHPVLQNGRVNNKVMPDDVKSKLFIKHGHPALSALSGAEVARLYTDAQNSC
jgi:hypothetical protein